MIQAFLELKGIHDKFDEARQELGRRISRPVCIGCGSCCRANTPSCMTIEAINAVSILTGQNRLEQAVKMAEDWLLTKHKEALSYEGMFTGCFLPPTVRDEWNSLSTSNCPFLTDEKRCFIYEGRPLSCRAFGVTRIATNVCPRPPGRHESTTGRMYIYSSQFREEVINFRKRCQDRNPAWIVSAFIPTLVYRAAQEKKFRDMVTDNKIASAKIVGVDIDYSLMWQPQLDSLMKGELPDLIAA